MKLTDKVAGKPAQKKQYEISVLEAGNMWNKLVARYDMIESIMIFMNYVQDEDLRKQLQSILKGINREVSRLEKVMAEHAINLPQRPPSEIKTEDISSITDSYIFRRVFNSIQWFLPMYIIDFQQSTSHKLREMFKGFLLEEIDIFERFQAFGLTKNWLQPQPDYKSEKTVGREKPTIIEVAQVWNKLSTRYDTMEFTSFMANLARDLDLKAVITIGHGTLKKQASELEKMLQQFAAPLPAKPPEMENTATPKDAISDRYIYRHILMGIQSFLPLHMDAFQNSTTPAVRQRLKRLLLEEIDIYDKFYSYGQLKGWVLEPPSFRE